MADRDKNNNPATDWQKFLSDISNGVIEVNWLEKKLEVGSQLTDGQLKVLAAILPVPNRKLSRAAIVNELNLGLDTVKTHLRDIYKKFQIDSLSKLQIELLDQFKSMELPQADRVETDSSTFTAPTPINSPTPQIDWFDRSNLAHDKSTPQQRQLFGATQIRDIPDWVGRDELLTELHADFANGRRMLVLHGQGGIGKTSLAVKLMAACGVDRSSSILPATCPYDNALYCEVNDADSFDSLVAKFLTAFGMSADRQGATPAQFIEMILTKLHQGRWLVTIDNLESLMEPGSSKSKSPDVGNLLNCLAYGGHNSQIIITSRKLPDDLRDRRGTKIDFSFVRAKNIKGILDADSVRLLNDLGAKDSQKDLEWIAERVRGNIFVLKLLADYSRKQPGILRDKPKLVTKEAKPIVRAQWELQSAPAQDLLQRMCVLRIGMDAEALTTLRLMQPHGKEMESTPEAEEVTEELLVGLVNCGLVEESYDNADCENLYVLHRLMAETLQAIFEEDLKCLWQYAASLYGAIDRPPEYRSFEDLQFLLEEAHYYWLLGTSTNYLISILIDRVLPCLNNWCYWDLEELWLNRLLRVYAELDNRQVKMASFRGLLGDIARKRGDYDKAATLYDQSLAVYTEFGDRAEMAYCWSGLGYIARKLGDYYKAEALYKQSLAVHTEFADRARMASCWTSLGYIASKRGDYDRAETLYKQSLAVYNESGDQAGIAISWGLLGDTALKRDDYERAEALYEQSLAVRTTLGDRARMATCWGGLGDIARKLGDYERAEALYKQSLAVRTTLGDRAGMAASWGCLGENEFVRGNLEAAETWLKKALPVFEELQVPDSLAELNWDLAQLYRAKGNEQIAQEHYATSYALYTTLGAKGELERIEKEWL